MTEKQATHHRHKIKAEWTKSANSEAYGSTPENDANCKIKIIEQVVIIPKKNQVKKSNNSNKSDTKKCGICERSFSNLQALEFHQKTHENSFFDCPETDCNKKFKRKSSLRKHLYFHRGKFKYACDDCGESFVDKVKFEIHAASKHQRVQRTFKCQLCTKNFTSADYLKRHQVTHKDEFKYSCKICNQKFKWLTSLQTHTQIHTQNKALMQCKECVKKFYNQRTLDRHIKIHINVRYQCSICEIIASNRKDNILRHVRHLHTEIPKTEVNRHVKVLEPKIKETLTESLKPIINANELQNDDNGDYDDEDNVLIIDESVRDEPEEPSVFINNRVNVIQSIGNPNKNLNIEKDHDKIFPSVSFQRQSEIQLPPKKKAIAKYNPIAQYRAILGLVDPEPQVEKKRSNNSEEVFPDHWRKRTSQNFLFKR